MGRWVEHFDNLLNSERPEAGVSGFEIHEPPTKFNCDSYNSK